MVHAADPAPDPDQELRTEAIDNNADAHASSVRIG